MYIERSREYKSVNVAAVDKNRRPPPIGHDRSKRARRIPGAWSRSHSEHDLRFATATVHSPPLSSSRSKPRSTNAPPSVRYIVVYFVSCRAPHKAKSARHQDRLLITSPAPRPTANHQSGTNPRPTANHQSGSPALPIANHQSGPLQLIICPDRLLTSRELIISFKSHLRGSILIWGSPRTIPCVPLLRARPPPIRNHSVAEMSSKSNSANKRQAPATAVSSPLQSSAATAAAKRAKTAPAAAAPAGTKGAAAAVGDAAVRPHAGGVKQELPRGQFRLARPSAHARPRF